MEMNRMKKIVYSTLFFAGMFLTTACSDYLEVGSPSIVDSDFSDLIIECLVSDRILYLFDV